MDRNRLLEIDAKDNHRVLDCQAHTALSLRVAVQDVKRVTPALEGTGWQIGPKGSGSGCFVCLEKKNWQTIVDSQRVKSEREERGWLERGGVRGLGSDGRQFGPNLYTTVQDLHLKFF